MLLYGGLDKGIIFRSKLFSIKLNKGCY